MEIITNHCCKTLFSNTNNHGDKVSKISSIKSNALPSELTTGVSISDSVRSSNDHSIENGMVISSKPRQISLSSSEIKSDKHASVRVIGIEKCDTVKYDLSFGIFG